MEREIINLTKFEIAPILFPYALEDEIYWEELCEDEEPKGIWDDFEIITDEINYFSLEDQYCEQKVIVKRISDDKFFKGKYTEFYSNGNEYEPVLIEVFPKEITITIYE